MTGRYLDGALLRLMAAVVPDAAAAWLFALASAPAALAEQERVAGYWLELARAIDEARLEADASTLDAAAARESRDAARADAVDAVAEMENEKDNAASWFSAFMGLGEELDAVTAERDDLLRRIAAEVGATARNVELCDAAIGRVAVLRATLALRDAAVARLEAEQIRLLAVADEYVAERDEAQAGAAVDRRLREAAEQERDATREQFAAARAEAERLAAELRRLDPDGKLRREAAVACCPHPVADHETHCPMCGARCLPWVQR